MRDEHDIQETRQIMLEFSSNMEKSINELLEKVPTGLVIYTFLALACDVARQTGEGKMTKDIETRLRASLNNVIDDIKKIEKLKEKGNA